MFWMLHALWLGVALDLYEYRHKWRPRKKVQRKLFANKLGKRRNRGTESSWRLRRRVSERNIVGCYKHVASVYTPCCILLDVVAQSLKSVKIWAPYNIVGSCRLRPFARSFRNANLEKIFTKGVVATRSSMQFWKCFRDFSALNK